MELENKATQKGLNYELKNKKTDIDNLKISSKEKTWEIKTKYSGGDRILEFCLDGKKGSQDDLFDHIANVQKPENELEKTIEDLKKEAEATQGENAKTYDKNEIQKINFIFSTIEENDIFSEVIVGNENIAVAYLIKELKNADWVKQGLDYLSEPIGKTELDEMVMEDKIKSTDKNGKCPFCQKETISKKLYQQIKNYFDETYNDKITELENLDKKYFTAYQDVKNKESIFLENPFVKNKEQGFKLLYKNFTEKLSSNWSKINSKVKNPSQKVSLESTVLEKKDLNDFLDKIVEEIKEHNFKVENKEKTKKEITYTFWQIMRLDYDQTIENYKSQKGKLKKEEKEIENQISELKIEGNKQLDIIKETQREIINIDEAIDNINTELKFLGAEGFKIKKEGDDSYKIKRENENETQFETLSEGEKTIISFLYFIELCKGKEEKNEVLTEKIIVIDDPISSLSHIYVFNISQLIKKHFFESENFKQIFILTHSLYFFHELWKYVKKEERKLFRIIKSAVNKSKIVVLKPDEIQNDYQAYWQILKDHDSSDASDALLANSMRNILEYFFGFIEKSKFNEAMNKINDGKYSYFIRYIDRESHSDLTNISDTKEIDPLIFKEAFKKIFKEAGYEEHYSKMME